MPCCGCTSTARADGRTRGLVVAGARGGVGGCSPSACDSVDELSEDAVIAARSRLNPAAGVMLGALWVAPLGQLVLIIHHLAVDGVSWRILLEDLNIAWAQHRAGQPVALPAAGTSFARWAQLLGEHAGTSDVVAQADAWRQVAATPAALPAVRPEVDTFANAGQLSVSLDDADTVRTLLREAPAAFHAGIQRHSVDRVRLGGGGVFGQPRHADRHRRRGTRPPRGTGSAGQWTCRARWGGSPPSTRCL